MALHCTLLGPVLGTATWAGTGAAPHVAAFRWCASGGSRSRGSSSRA